jgi:hypothetical protein
MNKKELKRLKVLELVKSGVLSMLKRTESLVYQNAIRATFIRNKCAEGYVIIMLIPAPLIRRSTQQSGPNTCSRLAAWKRSIAAVVFYKETWYIPGKYLTGKNPERTFQ